MKELKIKFEGEHSEKCKKSYGDKPDYYLRLEPADVVRRDAIGRKIQNPSRRWVRLVCNCTNCTATALVRVGDIEKAVAEGYVEQQKP